MVAPGIKDMTVPMCTACCFPVDCCFCGTNEHHINTEPSKKRSNKRGKKRGKNPFDKPLDDSLDKPVDLTEATRLATHLNFYSDLLCARRRHILPHLLELNRLPVSATMTADERQDFLDFLETTKCGLRLYFLRSFPDSAVARTAKRLHQKWKSALFCK